MQSYRHPGANWAGSPNFTPGRDGHDMAIQPAWVVLHTMVGTTAAASARFQQPSEQASATYGISLDGSLHQWVDEADAAWANGATGRNGRGDNLDSISIEHEDDGDFNGPRTDALYAASAELVRDVCTRYGIPIDRRHIIEHRECDFAQTACPDRLDIDRIVAAAAAGGGDDMFTDQDRVKLDGIFNEWQPTDGSPGLRQLVLDVVDAKAPAAVDAAAIATALAADTAFLDAVAGHTVALLGRKAST